MSHKTAESVGSAPADPVKAEGAVTPIPTPVLANKTAPGQTGPRGLSPRTTYSKVNTGAPPVSRAVDALKSTPARGVEFLPAKTAEDLDMTMAQRPTLQDMMKAAMAGTISKVDINHEVARQLAQQQGEDPEKTASADMSDGEEHYSSEHIEKMATALDYIGSSIKEADDGSTQQPGMGPGSLDVLEAQSSEKNIDAGEGGKAISQNLAKTDPPQQREEVQVGKANTGMDTNDATTHAEQPLKPIKNENVGIAPSNPLPTPTTQTKQSSGPGDLEMANLERMGKFAKKEDPEGHHIRRAFLGPVSAAIEAKKGKKLKSFGEAYGHKVKEIAKGVGAGGLVGGAIGAGVGAVKGGKKGALKGLRYGAGGGGYVGALGGEIKGTHGRKASEIHGRYSKHKEAEVNVDLIRKIAEEALSPSKIEAGKQNAPDSSASEESVPKQPSDVTSQARSMLSSNQAAIDYKKQEAKADPKSDVNQVLAQPALTRTHDQVLHKNLDNTNKAGVKLSSAQSVAEGTVKVAAARAILSNLMDKAGNKKKENCDPKGGNKKKEKDSTMGGAPSSPSSASGFTASSLG